MSILSPGFLKNDPALLDGAGEGEAADIFALDLVEPSGECA
jgi:hypothetical protein